MTPTTVQTERRKMKTLNLNSPSYKTHANNIAQIIIAAKYRDDAEKLVDLYLEIVNGSTDPSIRSHKTDET